MTAPDPRSRIRAWWKDQLATGQPVDLDAAAEEATQLLIADPAFVAAVAESLVKPLVRDIGQRTVQQRNGGRKHPPRVQVGSTVMSREHAMQLVDAELATRTPHWSKLVQREGEPQWFMALSRDELMAESKRRKADGSQRLREAAFLYAVANNLGSSQVVADVWSEQELDVLFARIDVQIKAGLKPEPQLSGATAAPTNESTHEGARAA